MSGHISRDNVWTYLQPCRGWRSVYLAQTQGWRWTGSHILCSTFRLCGSARTKFDDFTRHAEVRLAIIGFLDTGLNVDLRLDAGSARMAIVSSESLLGHIFYRIQYSLL